VKVDGRKISHDALETIRQLAVLRVWDGERPSEVIQSYGLFRTTIYRWLHAAERGGWPALKSRRAVGRPHKLTPQQRLEVRTWIDGKDPRQHGYESGLWMRTIVADLIRDRFGVTVDVTTVGRILHRLSITPQKPLHRAYERDPVAIERWKHKEYPTLKARATKRNAEIFFLDETGVRSDQALGRTWGIRGRTPEVPTSGKRQWVNAISAVNARGAFWYRVFKGRLNKETFVAFLKSFLRGRRRPVFLVVDSHPAHRAALVASFVQKMKGRLELHFLPGYAPELNPDEFIWHHFKETGISKNPLREGESLEERVESDLASIRRRPRLVRSIFRGKRVA
jgi:transposase